MLLAIDVGNSESDVGAWDGRGWVSVWRRSTMPLLSMDEFAEWLVASLDLAGVSPVFEGVIVSSVVPGVTEEIVLAAARVTGCSPIKFGPDPRLKMEIRYEPPTALGADRLANAIGARSQFQAPVLVVDIGTATTFEAVDRSGAFVGGAIMPGPALSAAAMVKGTATLPETPLEAPPGPIGQSTVHALQSGIMLGHAAAIQGLALQMVAELGEETTVIATGGLGEKFLPLCPVLSGYYPTLTLDGLVVAYGLLAG